MADKPTLEKIWIEDDSYPKLPMAIRFDWSNNRHHRVEIERPYTNRMLVLALYRCIHLIGSDKTLNSGNANDLQTTNNSEGK